MKQTPVQSGKTGIAKHSDFFLKKWRGSGISRDEMIAVAAYYRAEHRGSKDGNSVDDWLAAEVEIDAALSHPD